MKLEDVTATIRPRSDWEAVDLGFALVRRDFWRCCAVWWLAVGVPTALAVWLLWNHPVWLFLLFWWWRPAGSRLVLFELSRRLFGEAPGWRDVWREIPRAWTRRFFHRFILLRLSPWLPVTLAVESLEGLRGKDYKMRAAQISRRGEAVVVWIFFMADLITAWFGLGILLLILSFIPQGQDGAWQAALESIDWNNPHELPLLIVRLVVFCMMGAMMLADIFLTGAGFGIYINNRTWLEGWDVELAFRRLGERLARAGLVIFALLSLLALAPHAMADQTLPAERIEKIKEAPEFVVHKVTDRVPVPKNWDWLSFSGDASGISSGLSVLGYLIVAIAVGVLGWLIWKNRHIFMLRGLGISNGFAKPRARVVMGMEVTRESLPDDVPTAAMRLWESGHHHEALALLYRAAIAAFVHQHHIEIEESDTEGDCLRRVESAALPTHPYFQSLTTVWSALAYAGEMASDASMRRLCESWPFSERRAS